MKKRIISLVLVVATLFAMSSIAFTANAISNNVIVADGGCGNICYICGADSEGVGFRKTANGTLNYRLYNNIRVHVLQTSSGWSKVRLDNGDTGWVYSSLLRKDLKYYATKTNKTRYICGADSAGVGFRTGPNLYRMYGLSNNTPVYVYYILPSGWACVQYTYYNGNKFVSIIGYVYAKYLRK